MSSHSRNLSLGNGPKTVFGWDLSEFSFRLPRDFEWHRTEPPLSEGQHLRWFLGEWEPNIANEGTKIGVFGRHSPGDLIKVEGEHRTLSAIVELKGWGGIARNGEEWFWSAEFTCPIRAALICWKCLLSGKIQPPEYVVVSALGYPCDEFCSEGCCIDHLAITLDVAEVAVIEAQKPLLDDDTLCSDLPASCTFAESRRASLERTVRTAFVRVLDASEIETEILSRYGLARLDLQEFEQAIRGEGYDHTRPLQRGAAATAVVTEGKRGFPLASPQLGHSHSGGLSKVAGMHALKSQLWKEVVRPFRDPTPFVRYGLTIPNGILLFGPPGCGKTYIARQLAEELGCAFVELIPSEVASPYIHGSVSLIREVFEKAQTQAPCVLFIDEFEALVPSRADLGGFQQYKSEEVNEFLAQMNSSAAKRVLVIAATNEPQMIDSAVLRTGRLDKHIYVPPPDAKAREEMLALHLSGRHADPEIDSRGTASGLEGYSASDIKFIVDEAARDAMEHDQPITTQHIESAKRRVPPSVTDADVQQYLAFRTRGVSH